MSRDIAWAGAVDEDDMLDRLDQTRAVALEQCDCDVCLREAEDPDNWGFAPCSCSHSEDDHTPHIGCERRWCGCRWWGP